MASLAPGTVLAERFEILGVLGRGGMATVVLAHDRLRGERVALKVLHPHLAGDPAMAARLKREVQAAARVRHPAALVAHELHQLDGHTLLTLPYHPGQTLAERVAATGPMAPESVRAMGIRLAQALAHAHRAGVLHRDVNPNNVMVSDDGQAVLMDFGLARLASASTGHTAGVLGTTGYAAPEALDGQRGDPRSDLYGLGATLYLALTGQAPFAAATPLGVVQRQLADEPAPPSVLRPETPADLDDALLALLAREPDQRPQAASEVARVLHDRQGPEAWIAVSDPALPLGSWTVLVGETGEDAGRRQALRVDLGMRTSTASDDLERFVRSRIWGGFKQVLGIPEGITPERHLVRSVARSAGLPDDALVPPEALMEPRFRLVDRVDEGTARSLQTLAGQAGFKALAVRIGAQPEPGPRWRNPWLLALLSLALAGAGALVAGVTWAAVVAVFAAIATVFVWGLVSRPATSTRGEDWAASLPVAFAALASHLAPGHRVEATLIQRVQSRLDRLDAALEEGVAHFTSAAIASGRATLRRLRAEAQALSQDLGQLDTQLQGALQSERPASELAWLGSRRDRLETQRRAGEPIDPEELGRLTAELEDQADVAAVVEALTARRTRTTTQLLELGASAHRARQDLARAVSDDAPATPVLDRLDQAHDERVADPVGPRPARGRTRT